MPLAYVTGTQEIQSANRVLNACEKHWNAWSSDCSGFARAVCRELGVPMVAGDANAIFDSVKKSPWRLIPNSLEAARQARLGNLVVAVMKGSPHGHITVIVATDSRELGRGKYPRGYWGRWHGIGKKFTTINWSFDEAGITKAVIYSCVGLPRRGEKA